jgi:hypothetical protein
MKAVYESWGSLFVKRAHFVNSSGFPKNITPGSGGYKHFMNYLSGRSQKRI